MSKKFTKKQLKKMNKTNSSVKINGGRIEYSDCQCEYHAYRRRTFKSNDGIAIITTVTKKTTKKGAKGQVVVP